MAVKKRSGLVIYSYLKDGAFTAVKRYTAVSTSMPEGDTICQLNGYTKEVLFLSKIV